MSLPLQELRLLPRHHRSALWWLGILYRRPAQLHQELETLPRSKAILAGIMLCLHMLPYMVILCGIGRWVLLGLPGMEPIEPLSSEPLAAFLLHLRMIAGGIAFGIAGGIAMGIAFGIAAGITAGIAVGIASGITLGIAVGIAFGIVFGIAAGIAIGIPSGIVYGTAVWIASGIGSGIGFGIAIGIPSGIAVGIASLRAYYHPLHPFFVWPQAKGRWYRFHPVAWDDLCSLPFPGLDRLLVAYAEDTPAAGQQEIERLITTYPSQRLAALRAWTRLLARQARRETRLTRLDGIVARLPEGEEGFLTQTRRLREMVGEICGLQQRVDTQQRPLFREPFAALLYEKIENFQYQISGFHEPLASEFRAAAQQWLKLAKQQHADAQRVLSKLPTQQVFRTGDPVDRAQEAFVPRHGVLGDLDRQLTLSTGCPGLILYGCRRMGKSTLLRNLDGFLPPEVRIAVVSMQEPRAFTSVETFLDLVTQKLLASWSSDGRPEAGTSDLPGFYQFLEHCNQRLEHEGQRLLLALDEYEYVDRKIGEMIFSEDLLTMLRESIQSHRRLTWVFAGHHHITELTHAPWSSYLVSVRTLEVPPFTEAETRLLLTDPLKYSPLWESDDPKRHPFGPAFWGDGSIERIHTEAGGWPHLVQLLAGTTVDLFNDIEDTQQVNTALLERAIDKAVTVGDTVLRQLLQPKDALPEEWEYLRGFRTRDVQPPPDNERVYQALRRRLLVAEENGEWRLRVPLMQRWLRQRG
jgi:hypothetical protein